MDDQKKGRSFSLIELLIVGGVIAALLVPLTPTVHSSRVKVRALERAQHLHQIGLALKQIEGREIAVSPDDWTLDLAPFLNHDYRSFYCPEHPDAGHLKFSYGMNNRAHRMLGGDSHKIVLLDYNKLAVDVVGTGASDDWLEEVAARHSGSCNVLRYDGSVELSLPEDIDPRECDNHNSLWRPRRDVGHRFDRPGCTPTSPRVEPDPQPATPVSQPPTPESG